MIYGLCTVLLEGVQRRTTKLVEGIKDWSYDARLEYLRLSSLVTRQVRFDLIETFTIETDTLSRSFCME